MSFYSDRNRPLIVAHRGASALEHENTAAAFERAIELKADAIELDLRRTTDGVIVVHHDARIKSSDRPLTAMTLIQARESAWRAGFELPTLEETLKQFGSRIVLDMELKEPGYEHEIIALVTRFLGREQFLFRSFKDHVVQRLKDMRPDITSGLIIGSRLGLALSGARALLPLQRRLRDSHADFISPHWRLVTRRFMARMRKLGCPVIPWTVDDPYLARKCVRLGVAAIVTNNPGELARVAVRD